MDHNISFPNLGLSFTINDEVFPNTNIHIRWYGVLIAVGFGLAVLYAWFSRKKMNIDMDRLLDAVIVGLIGAIIGARLYYIIFLPDNSEYWNDPIKILKINEGGLAIYGGIIGAMVCGGITAKLRKLRVFAVLDVAALGFLIGQCIGRWGNFINQEAFGGLTDLPWAMYSENTQREVGGAAHPCFLYESLLCLIGFIMLHFFTRKLRRYDGQTFLLYIVWYGFCRFFIEGLRSDSLMIPYLNLKVSQVLAAACVIVGVILLIVFRNKTSLSGCGSRTVMEGVGLNAPEEPEAEEKASDDADDKKRYSTIFGDLPPFEEDGGEEKSDEDTKEQTDGDHKGPDEE